MSEIFYVVPEDQHNALVAAGYRKRGYSAAEATDGARFCAEATRHGIRTHNALKALHLDHRFGSAAGGCVPKTKIEKIKTRFKGAEVWNANKKLGQATGYAAIKLADKYGVGMVSVDNAFHYLWGFGYVMDAARSAKNSGLLFSDAEIHAFNDLAKEARKAKWKVSDYKVAE